MVTKPPGIASPKLQAPTSPVIVSVAVNPVNLVGRNSIGFKISYEREFPTPGVRKTAVTSNMTKLVHTRQVKILKNLSLSTKSIKTNFIDNFTYTNRELGWFDGLNNFMPLNLQSVL